MSGLYHDVVSLLVKNISKKNQVLNQLLDLTIKQGERILEENVDLLDDLVSQKEGLLLEVEKLNEAFDRQVLELKIDERYGLLETKDKLIHSNENLKCLWEQSHHIGNVITEVDAKNLSEIRSLLENLKSQIKSNHHLKKLEKSYNSEFYTPDGAYYFDKKK
jgi:hypothetical protein